MKQTPESSEAVPRPSGRPRLRIWQALVLWWAVMFPLVFWGLPSAHNDDLLFGGEQAWSPERYRAEEDLEARRQRAGGADTDLDPLSARAGVVTLTQTDVERAAILRRYRLFTRQPDEMITLMALQRMNPRELDFDPQLYQYGGAYIYMVGAVLEAAKLCGLLTVTSDVGVYLARPELFAWFYVLARLITLAFGALTLAAVARLAGRAGGRRAAWAALLFVACSPVFITGVLEAKPHLPSACLLLWAVLFALDFLAKQRRKDALRLGLSAGGACGLVLTGFAGLILWPVAWLAARGRAARVRALLAAGVCALVVFVATNPYPIYNALFRPERLSGNLDNSTAMYRFGGFSAGATRTAQLLLECCGPAALLFGVVGLIQCARRWPRQTALVCAPAAALLVLCLCIGAGKPAEFARFLLLPAITLLLAAAIFIADVVRRRRMWGICVFVLALALMRTPAYLRSFYLDTRQTHDSRRLAGLYIHGHIPADESIGLLQEPAPYSVPPLDFGHREIRLLPAANPTRHDYLLLPNWIVLTADDETVYHDRWWRSSYRLERTFAGRAWELSRIAWANKPVYVYRRVQTAIDEESPVAP